MTDPRRAAEALIRRHYAAFNAGDAPATLALLTDDVRREPDQGAPRCGRAAFAAFLRHMERCYAERLEDVVAMTDAAGDHAAAAFTVRGRYTATDERLPEATGQAYVRPAGTFLTLRHGRIAQAAPSCNLPDWLAQVSA